MTLRDPAMDRCVALRIAHILVVLSMILLAAGALTGWLGALGVVVMPIVHNKLHCVAPAELLQSPAVLIAARCVSLILPN